VEAMAWRNQMQAALEEDFEVLNPMGKPMMRELYLEKGKDTVVADSYEGDLSASNIFSTDMEDVLAANYIVADLTHGTVFGTPFEVGVAWAQGAVVVFIDPEDKFGKHPFVGGLVEADDPDSAFIVRSYDEAIDTLRQLVK
jgi:nucleoside 2-deoxyribosyltransferase